MVALEENGPSLELNLPCPPDRQFDQERQRSYRLRKRDLPGPVRQDHLANIRYHIPRGSGKFVHLFNHVLERT